MTGVLFYLSVSCVVCLPVCQIVSYDDDTTATTRVAICLTKVAVYRYVGISSEKIFLPVSLMSKLLTTRNCYNDVSYFEMTSERRSFLVLDKDRSDRRSTHLSPLLFSDQRNGTNQPIIINPSWSIFYYTRRCLATTVVLLALCSIADIEQLTYGLDAFDNAKGKGP